MPTEQITHESQNPRTAVGNELIDEILGGRADNGTFEALASLTIDAVISEDTETLSAIHSGASRGQSPFYELEETTKARLEVFASLCIHGSQRAILPVSDGELTYLQLADGNSYRKNDGSEFTDEERNLIRSGSMVCRGYWMELTPRGRATLERTRLQIEKRSD